ncbi:type II toxin-antitoxin system HicB family antitoxin [Thiorhodococcus minor]|uniref:DUF1902 domain-containing protein n=1 Tax=Thiorhodococcus minor TaxID=57489 RepID=A0A6M0K6B8_9GAMM|nr:DUF1902 domain-containing protein [Thiorhodococcus minor]NEV64147.1 DUF1902 domain-containing protein [Thiorhodococcus minor]
MTSIRPTELRLRCYAEREAPDVWVALCLDFDLAAQGETFEDAKAKLDAMIDDYVRDAWEGEDQPFAESLLNRRAPLRYWLRFWWFSLWSRIRHRNGTHRPFNGRLPLSLAH